MTLPLDTARQGGRRFQTTVAVPPNGEDVSCQTP